MATTQKQQIHLRAHLCGEPQIGFSDQILMHRRDSLPRLTAGMHKCDLDLRVVQELLEILLLMLAAVAVLVDIDC